MALNGRDDNAARNIQAVGASTVGLGDVRRAVLNPESHGFYPWEYVKIKLRYFDLWSLGLWAYLMI